MPFQFSDSIPAAITNAPVCISGRNSYYLPHTKYLLLQQEQQQTNVFEIKYETAHSPFEQAELQGNILAAGYSEYFYLFDLAKGKGLLALNMQGYFGHFYFHEEHFYVADSRGLYKINMEGTTLWKNNNLGIDGVIVGRFEKENIIGSGEWDPPGGWVDFILDIQTGAIKKDGG